MPTVPVYRQQIATTPDVAPVLQNINVSPDVYGVGLAQGVSNLGQGVEHVGAIIKHEEQRVLNNVSNEADNKVRAEQARLKGEAQLLKAQQWQGKEHYYQQKLQETIQESAKSIPDPVRRQQFLSAHSVTQEAFSADINSLYTDRTERYAEANAVSSAQMHAETASSLLYSGDIKGAEQAMAKGVTVQTDFYTGKEPPATTQIRTGAYVSKKVLTPAVERALNNGDFNRAEELLKMPGYLDEDRSSLERALLSHRNAQEINSKSSLLKAEIYKEFGNDIKYGRTAKAQAALLQWGVANSKTNPLAEQIASEARKQLAFSAAADVEKTAQIENDIILRGKDGKSTPEDIAYLDDLKKTDIGRYRNINAETNNTNNMVMDNANVYGSLDSRIRAAEARGDRSELAKIKNDIIASRSSLSSATIAHLSEVADSATTYLDKTPKGMEEHNIREATDNSLRLFYGGKGTDGKPLTEISKLDETVRYQAHKYIQDKVKANQAELRAHPDKLNDSINKWMRDYTAKSQTVESSGIFNSWVAQEQVSEADYNKYIASPSASSLDPVARDYVGQLDKPAVAAQFQDQLITAARNDRLEDVYPLLRATGMSKEEITKSLDKAAAEINRQNGKKTEDEIPDANKNTLENRVRKVLAVQRATSNPVSNSASRYVNGIFIGGGR